MTILIPRRSLAARLTGPTLGQQPTDYVSLRRDTDVGTTSGVWHEVQWETEVSDASNFWASGTPGSVIIPAGKDGYYIFNLRYEYASAGSAVRQMAEVWGASDGSPRQTMGRSEFETSVCGLIECVAGNALKFMLYNGGFSPTLLKAELEMVRLAS